MTEVTNEPVGTDTPQDGRPDGRRRWWWGLAAIVVAAAVVITVVAVRRGSTPADESAPTTTASIAPSTTAARSSTSTSSRTTASTPTSTGAPSTTVPPTTDAHLLTLDGIGPATFGMTMDQAAQALVPSFGAPTSDAVTEGCITARRIFWGGVVVSAGPAPDDTFVDYAWLPTQGGPAMHTASGYGSDLTPTTLQAHLAAVQADWPGAELVQSEPSVASITIQEGGIALRFKYVVASASGPGTPAAAGDEYLLNEVLAGPYDPANPDPYGCS